ncbi:hypothetical protein [Oceaniglobus trochenteri]|uniref:hypothetical protein n=1 Tax=Oceaniglobus trochenteri TaxID=2763260 RepID=UPI001D000E3D|nr:hypothetical protein [Oceaniglobus trochenteri]
MAIAARKKRACIYRPFPRFSLPAGLADLFIDGDGMKLVGTRQQGKFQFFTPRQNGPELKKDRAMKGAASQSGRIVPALGARCTGEQIDTGTEWLILYLDPRTG